MTYTEQHAKQIRDHLVSIGELRAFFHHSTGQIVYIPRSEAAALNSADYTPVDAEHAN